MSDRNQDILHQLIKERKMNEETLLQKFNLTPRQLSYSIDSINGKLAEKKLPLIEKKYGQYNCHSEVVDYLTVYQTIQDIVFSKEDRSLLIVILILTRNEELSLEHFCQEMQISKNTVVTDIKRTKDRLASYHLTIEFTRKRGYVIAGDEWSKRSILLQAITKIYRGYGEKVIRQLLSGSQSYITAVKEDIIKIEKYLSVKYTDEDFYPLIFFVGAVLKRIDRGQQIDSECLTNQDEIKQTREYQSLLYLMSNFSELPEVEREYIALQFLSANVRNKRLFSEKDLPLLANSLWEFLTEFEANTFLVLSDKKELLKKLINHFKPAYYRIKYNISIDNVLYEKIRTEYRVLHNFVKQSINPLESFFQTKISDEEIAYITLFVGGHLVGSEHNDFEEKVTKAVILCPNGTSMSKLIEKNLKKIFPEFLFYPTNSIREYKKFLLPHDIVFSTVPVESSKKVYVINEILNNSEQLKLRRHVIKDVFQLDFTGVRSADILKVVKQYAEIANERKLLEELDSLLLSESMQNESEAHPLNAGLPQVLSEPFISIVETTSSWESVMDQLVEPLIQEEIISEEYRTYLKREYSNQPSYILLRQKIVLPHLDPDFIPQKLGVSMLIMKNGVLYNNQQIYVAVLLATPDKTSHLNILYDIDRLAKNAAVIKQLVGLTTGKEAAARIKEFIEEGDSRC